MLSADTEEAGKWFALGILTGLAACLAILVAHNIWGNAGAGIATGLISAPIIILERWLYVRAKERASVQP